jgi:membrane peptidoglycan carboxypeptidase
MVGSYDFTDDAISGQVNNATALNQPGSTMKPVTYLTAFLKGWSPTTKIVDEPIKIGQGDDAFTLGNADKRYRGEVTVRTALGSSLNVPAVKTLQYAGLENVYNLARRMGVSTLRELSNYGPSFTLGGADVSLLDMTFVYTTLANYGEQAGMPSVLGLPEGSRPLDPIAVLKIEDAEGDTLWEANHRRVRIVPADQTYLITDILSDDSARVSMFGANSPLNLPRPAAVKSGASDETRDAWTIGYTPQIVAGVWVGNANNAPIPNGTSTYTAAPIWRSFMLAALQGKPALAFQKPGSSSAVAGQQQTPVQGAGLKATPTPKSNVPPGQAKKTPQPTETPRPTRTLRPADPTSTPQPTRTLRPRDPTNTPRPTATPN